MNTQYFSVAPDNPDLAVLRQAADILRQGGLVAFPTETVYGLGANGLDAQAATKIYQAKGRPSDNPLILHIAEITELERLSAKISPQTKKLLHQYWPGPLTVVLEKTPLVPDIVTGGLNTVAVRMPDSKTARELIRLAGVPLAAPSANTSGRPSPTNAQAVLDDLNGKIDAIVDAGTSAIGLESTVVDLTGDIPCILRPGGITAEMIAATLGQSQINYPGEKTAAPKSPGMKYTHYAPKYPLILAPAPILKQKITQYLTEPKKVGAIVSQETAPTLPRAVHTITYGSHTDLPSIAASLYSALRHFDTNPVDLIFAESVPETGIGAAIMNRLRKAACIVYE
ncbi:MAG: threonylcarbamoyl-AMP synthase [Sporomusaceae bacterium]|jgi:L-threonylcarbamoyladenylate synthase|nr:threonylcarbamoyl-AMP synthase [Sporomusaceae bacterium]